MSESLGEADASRRHNAWRSAQAHALCKTRLDGQKTGAIEFVCGRAAASRGRIACWPCESLRYFFDDRRTTRIVVLYLLASQDSQYERNKGATVHTEISLFDSFRRVVLDAVPCASNYRGPISSGHARWDDDVRPQPRIV